MKFDLHTHHSRCGHAIGEIEDYIQAAINADMDVIGISDHSPFFASTNDQPFPSIAMPTSEFPNYIAEVLQLKEKYRDQIEVLLGVESDFFAEHKETYKKAYVQYPFDYIIGSVHVSNGTPIFDRERWHGMSEADLLREKEVYFETIQHSARSNMFDILGHIDALKGFNPRIADIDTPIVEQTLKVIADCGVAIEINTSGKNKDCGGWYPADDILEKACHYGVRVTFGSDSHTPERIGDERENVRNRLKEIGFTEWVFFRQRKEQVVQL